MLYISVQSGFMEVAFSRITYNHTANDILTNRILSKVHEKLNRMVGHGRFICMLKSSRLLRKKIEEKINQP